MHFFNYLIHTNLNFFKLKLELLKMIELDTIAHLRKEFEIRVFDESFNRIRRCLSLIDEKDLWSSPNAQISSIGVLVEHVIGNASQWICAALGEQPDTRIRDVEFEVHDENNISDMRSKVDQCEVNLRETICKLKTNVVNQKFVIQGIESTGFSVVVHVIEHVSYHTGQITFLTKYYTGKQTDYYGEMDLNLSIE